MNTRPSSPAIGRRLTAALAFFGLLAGVGLQTGCSQMDAGADETADVGSVPADLHQSFAVTAGGRLVIDADRGAIEIATGSDDAVQVEVLRKVTRGSANKARQILAAHKVTFDQDGSTVRIRARLEDGIKSWRGWGSGLQVRYVVTVPSRFDLELKTAGGSITVPDLAGTVVAGTSGGSIKLGAITGPATCRTSGGNISVSAGTDTIDARTSGGNVEVGMAQQSARLGTSGGSIRVGEARGPLHVETSGGNIRIQQALASVEASTSGGSIQAGLTAPLGGDCRLSTSGGDVKLTLPQGINAELDARTSGGSVSSELPVTVQGEVKHSALQVRLGDGGPLIRLRTSGGSIHVVKG